MQFTNTVTFTAAVFLGTFSLANAACTDICVHNGDAGRWIDSNSPAGVVDILSGAGGGCYQATVQGNMCVSLTGSDGDVGVVSSCLEEVAADWQSYHGDWFLYSAISCTFGSVSGTIAIT